MSTRPFREPAGSRYFLYLSKTTLGLVGRSPHLTPPLKQGERMQLYVPLFSFSASADLNIQCTSSDLLKNKVYLESAYNSNNSGSHPPREAAGANVNGLGVAVEL